jgi:predicted lipoprotein with Yx(FWY)xxD motif
VRRAFVGVPIVIAFGLLTAACGSSSSSSSAGAPSTGSAVASTTSSGSSSNNPYSSGATSSSAAAGSAVKISTKHSKFGTVLAAGPKQMTVYLFEGDKGAKSNCNSACAKAWPPVTTSGTAGVGGKAVSGDLGTTMRSNGTEQVTYKGHPLYYFIKDKDDGDAYGQGAHAFGADWYVVAPSGNKVDNS